MKLDPRKFSQEAYSALVELRDGLDANDCGKASALVQGLVAYISTWGLHRLSGDAAKFSGREEKGTGYKGKVYKAFLVRLQVFSQQPFDPNDQGALLNMNLTSYTALNRLAVRLAREWSFWSPAILGEAEDT